MINTRFKLELFMAIVIWAIIIIAHFVNHG